MSAEQHVTEMNADEPGHAVDTPWWLRRWVKDAALLCGTVAFLALLAWLGMLGLHAGA